MGRSEEQYCHQKETPLEQDMALRVEELVKIDILE